jgi:hypothetical protein
MGHMTYFAKTQGGTCGLTTVIIRKCLTFLVDCEFIELTV